MQLVVFHANKNAISFLRQYKYYKYYEKRNALY